MRCGRTLSLIAAWLTALAPVLAYAVLAVGPGPVYAELCTAQGVQRVAVDPAPDDPAGALHLVSHCDLCVGSTASAVATTPLSLSGDLQAEAPHALPSVAPWRTDVLGLPRPRGPPQALA